MISPFVATHAKSISFQTGAIVAYDKPPNDLSLDAQAKLLGTAFLATNVVDLIERASSLPTSLNPTDAELLDEAVSFLNNIDNAYRYVYESDLNLIPNADALETISRLGRGTLALDPAHVGQVANRGKDVLQDLRNNPAEFNENDLAKLKEVQELFRVLHIVVLEELDRPTSSWHNDPKDMHDAGG